MKKLYRRTARNEIWYRRLVLIYLLTITVAVWGILALMGGIMLGVWST